MPQKMTSEDFAEYGVAGVPSALLHIGAVDPAKLKQARETGIPVPAPHSPEWAPDREPTLKGRRARGSHRAARTASPPMIGSTAGEATGWNQRHSCGARVNPYGVEPIGGSIERSTASIR